MAVTSDVSMVPVASLAGGTRSGNTGLDRGRTGTNRRRNMQVKFENGVVQLDIATLAEDEAVAREVAKHALTEEVLLTAFAQLAVDGSIEWIEIICT